MKKILLLGLLVIALVPCNAQVYPDLFSLNPAPINKPNLWTGGYSLLGLAHQQTSGIFSKFNDFTGDDVGLTHGETIAITWLFQDQSIDSMFRQDSSHFLDSIFERPFIYITLSASTDLKIVELGKLQFPEETTKGILEIRAGEWSLYAIAGLGIKHKNYDSNGLAFFTATSTRTTLHDIINQNVKHTDSGKSSETSALLKFGIGGESKLLTHPGLNLLFRWDLTLGIDTYDTLTEEGLIQNVEFVYGTDRVDERRLSRFTLSGGVRSQYNFENFDATVKAAAGVNINFYKCLNLGANGFVQYAIYDGIQGSFDGKNEVLFGFELIFTQDFRK